MGKKERKEKKGEKKQELKNNTKQNTLQDDKVIPKLEITAGLEDLVINFKASTFLYYLHVSYQSGFHIFRNYLERT